MQPRATIWGALLAAALVLPGCGPEAEVEQVPVASPMMPMSPGAMASPGMGGAAMTVSAGDIARNPTTYIGQTVTVKGEVERVIERRGFTIDEDAAFAGPDLLVVAPNITTPVTDDQYVSVTGRVMLYEKTVFERDYDWFDLTPDFEAEFSSRPVLVADTVMPTTEEAAKQAEEGDTPAPMTSPATTP